MALSCATSALGHRARNTTSRSSSCLCSVITLIPMAVIPQIILSGAISPLKGLSKVLALIGVSTYWGKRGLDGCLPEEVTRAMQLGRGSIWMALPVLLLHAALGVALSIGVLRVQSRRGRNRAVK